MHQQLKSSAQQSLRDYLGEKILAFLNEPDVTEVRCNEDGALWVDGYAGKRQVGSFSAECAHGLIGIVASTLDQVVTANEPTLAGEMYLTEGDQVRRYRFQGFIPPVTAGPAFIIRKPAQRIYSLDDYLDSDMMTAEHHARIMEAVQARRNILVVGGTGSGKTTLCNAILAEIAVHFPDDRIILIEDTQELQCRVRDCQPLRSCESRPIDALVRAALRASPDRIIVGEVRGAEAHWMLKAWNTGHDGGICTVHANDAREGLRRMEDLVQEAGVPPIPQAIASTVHMVVWIARAKDHPKGRMVREVAWVRGYDNDAKQYVIDC